MLTPFTTHSRWSNARRFVIAVVAMITGIVWTHVVAALVRHHVPTTAPLMAIELTWAAAGLAVLAGRLLPSRLTELAVAGWGAVAVLAFAWLEPGAGSRVWQRSRWRSPSRSAPDGPEHDCRGGSTWPHGAAGRSRWCGR